MSADRIRILLIALIVAAAVVSYVGNRSNSRVVSSLGFGVFLVAVLVYPYWRRAVRRERDARVFDREAKTDETGSRTDQ
jgi:uncharacterized membrane protein YfcA